MSACADSAAGGSDTGERSAASLLPLTAMNVLATRVTASAAIQQRGPVTAAENRSQRGSRSVSSRCTSDTISEIEIFIKLKSGSVGFRRRAASLIDAHHDTIGVETTALVSRHRDSGGARMTAPVSPHTGPDGSWVIRFCMPTPH
ncbi:hypothetical protein MBOT_07920 [Mycobacterium botniense]|uniref:Uncharacterized protein n=1 Tax=Mycobacterium botniense TaxID=84962 RepID=A0A7I9XV85_9MYCO|nr:hypothetical protein MBOT_07920 [Mycobacterium botniense]